MELETEEPHPDIQPYIRALRLGFKLGGIQRFGARGLRFLQRPTAWIKNRRPLPVGVIENGSIPGPANQIPVRAYRPQGTEPFPTIVFFHGGGFVAGSLDTHDQYCRKLTRATDAVVLSVGYRLAPEHQFPAAVEDAYAAVEWAANHTRTLQGDGTLVVAGDSAGGNLAAVTTLLARDRGGPSLDHQVLLYPAVGIEEDHDSIRRHDGIVLSEETLRWLESAYYGSEIMRRHPYADPIQACDLNGLPPATIATAGFDPLRDGGIAYAARLQADDVPVEHYHYPDMIHGFATMFGPWGTIRAAECLSDVKNDLKRVFSY